MALPFDMTHILSKQYYAFFCCKINMVAIFDRFFD